MAEQAPNWSALLQRYSRACCFQDCAPRDKAIAAYNIRELVAVFRDFLSIKQTEPKGQPTEVHIENRQWRALLHNCLEGYRLGGDEGFKQAWNEGVDGQRWLLPGQKMGGNI